VLFTSDAAPGKIGVAVFVMFPKVEPNFGQRVRQVWEIYEIPPVRLDA